MTYEIGFSEKALKEWRKLGHTVRDQFKKKLAERMEAPHVPGAKLRGAVNRYKIKLRTAGYRLVYEVNATQITITVIAVGRRDDSEFYDDALDRH